MSALAARYTRTPYPLDQKICTGDKWLRAEAEVCFAKMGVCARTLEALPEHALLAAVEPYELLLHRPRLVKISIPQTTTPRIHEVQSFD